MSNVPPWLQEMEAIKGIQYWPDGGGDRDEIHRWLDFIGDAYPEMKRYCQSEKTLNYFSWCGLAVGYCMAKTGLRPPFGDRDTDRFLWAEAWLDWGAEAPRSGNGAWMPKPGDVAVFDFGNGDQHVTLFLSDNGQGGWDCLGGNQTHQIRTITFSSRQVIGVRTPNFGAPEPARKVGLHSGAPSAPDEAWSSYDIHNLEGTGGNRMAGLTPDVIAAARQSQFKWRVPASVTLAQYILESSAGRNMPAGSNNPFGIKAGGDQPSVMAWTWEEKNGKRYRIRAPFRKFASIADAFDAHGQLLARHYPDAMAHVDDPNAFADRLTGHYATASDYGTDLKRVMVEYDLRRYDDATPDASAGSGLAPNRLPATTQDGDQSMALSLGSTGDLVKALQQALSDLGYWPGGVDGQFGSLTQQALLGFQAENGLQTDGVAGPEVWSALKIARPRSLSKVRTNATASDLGEMGSRIVQHADNTSLAGLIAIIFGGLGVGNSIAVNSTTASGTATVGAENHQITDTIGKVIDALNATASTPTKPITGAQAGDLSNILKGVVSTINSATGHPSLQINSVFDFLANNPEISGGLHTILESLSTVAGSVVPGFGGSLLALGLGFAARYFGSQISQARTDDHNSGINIANLPNRAGTRK